MVHNPKTVLCDFCLIRHPELHIFFLTDERFINNRAMLRFFYYRHKHLELCPVCYNAFVTEPNILEERVCINMMHEAMRGY